MYDQNVTGTDEIVTIIDSGIDTEHCFFRDEHVPVPFNRADKRHRKIIRYDTLADRTDIKSGHGTHTCGIIAGNALCSNCSGRLYNGHAPDAKLYFVDAGDRDDTEILSVNINFFDIVQNAINLGSRTFSCSWGYSLHDALPLVRPYDYMFFTNPNVTFVFPAGNSGLEGDILTPGTCKNAITVGATNESNAGQALNGDSFFATVDGIKYPLKKASDTQFSSLLEGDTIPELTVSTDCNGPDPIIVISEQTGKCEGLSKPVFTINNDDYSKIQGKTIMLGTDFVAEKPSTLVRATFSSQGPSMNGLLKPDVVAPGTNIVSARAKSPGYGMASLMTKDGTSMATPAIGGAIALVHQYFRDGHYFNISMPVYSHLMRALVISSASPLANGDFRPSIESGFGAVHLSNVLQEGLWICPNCTITGETTLKTTVDVERAGKLTVTLSWLDPPLDEESQMPLYADLDLILVSPTGDVYYGNQDPSNNTDSHSANERVIADAVPGRYQVYVTCPPLFDDSISFALVVVGNLPPNRLPFIAFSEVTECPGGCVRGVCVNGSCHCPQGYVGLRCQTAVATSPFELHSRSPRYMAFEIPALADSEEFRINITLAGTTRRSLLQTALSLNNVAKYGGDLVDFRAHTSPRIDMRLRKDILGSLPQTAFLELFEATSSNWVVNVAASVGPVAGTESHVNSRPHPVPWTPHSTRTPSHDRNNPYLIVVSICAVAILVGLVLAVSYQIKLRRKSPPQFTDNILDDESFD